MRSLFSAVLGATLLVAAPALAWSEHPSGQPASSEIAVWAYPSKHNYCPAGLQPVTIGGVICCGQPTHHGYSSHHAPRQTHGPKANAMAYDKGSVAYDKGYAGN